MRHSTINSEHLTINNGQWTKSKLSNAKCQMPNDKGLTLIEVLVAMGIATVAGALLVVIMVNSAGLFSQQSSKVQSGLNINDALAQVRGSIKQASSVAEVYSDGSISYTTGTNQLVLKIASVDATGNIIASTYDYFVFYLDGTTLHFRVFPDSLSSRKSADRIFSTIVDDLNFQYLNSAIPAAPVTPVNATKVRISLSLKQKVGVTFETNTATSEANLRND